MPEIISINIGQAGVQMSNAAWELFCTEHGIKADGFLQEHLSNQDSTAFKTFFEEVPTGQFVPRSLSVDLEPTVLGEPRHHELYYMDYPLFSDEVRTGAYRKLWHPDQLISGSEDAANNYARGHFTLGKLLINTIIDRIRKEADLCDVLQGFVIINSNSGGTGSGLTAMILERISIEYAKGPKFQISIIPCNTMSTAIVEPYNSLLSMNASTTHTDICNMTDNEAVYYICTTALDITRPTYSNINRVMAQMLSSLTVSLRFESSLNADLNQISTNLIPFPRIHYLICNCCPLISARRAEHEKMSTKELTSNVFHKSSQMVSVDLRGGKYMACCLQYRGDIPINEAIAAIFEIKRRTDVKFVDWCPTGFKLGINCQPPIAVIGSELAQTTKSVTMLSNSTAIGEIWVNIGRKFDVLFSKRAFVHWYVGEGMEESEFNESRDEMAMLIQDYENIATDGAENDNGQNIAGGEQMTAQTVTSNHDGDTKLYKINSTKEERKEETEEMRDNVDTAEWQVEVEEETYSVEKAIKQIDTGIAQSEEDYEDTDDEQ